MAAPPVEVPCEVWSSEDEVRACCSGLDPAFDLTAAIRFASAILYRLSGRQFPGVCTRTIWPCSGRGCGCTCGGCGGGCNTLGGDWFWAFDPYPSFPLPNGAGSGWVNCSGCSRDSCCLPSVDLPATVNEITEIVIDGEILDPAAYAIQAYRRVVRVDGGSWPCSNAFGDVGDPDTWTITYEYGKPVPLDGRLAASIFACQIALARCGGDSCLPARLKEISRQDVDMAFADPMEFIGLGQTGIYEVDMWLESVNPGFITRGNKSQRLRRRARVHRADAPPGNTTFTG